MSKEPLQNLRLGIFIIAGTIFLIVAFYLIGTKRNLFGSTFRVGASFHNVSGLMTGNNVRFSGIDVGTVESVRIISDSSVRVVMIIDEKVRQYIKKNSLAVIGTDGLMGNKLVNIISIEGDAPVVEENDVLRSLKPVETDEMIRTLSNTNENVQSISTDLKNIMQKLNNDNSLWSILMDTAMADNLKSAIVNIRLTSRNSATITGDLSGIIRDVKKGEGIAGTLLSDTIFSDKLEQSIVKINFISDKLATVSGDLSRITGQVKDGEGTVGTLLMDTSFARDFRQSMENIREGTDGFNDNMEALKHSFLLRRYFKKTEKNGSK